MGFDVDQSGELIGLIQRLWNPGFILMYGGGTPPPGGYALCDGSTLLEIDYPQTFAVLGTAYNDGSEGPGEFRLPDFRGRSPLGLGTGSGLTPRAMGDSGGLETVTLGVGEMPSHTHVQQAHTHVQDAHTHVQDPHNHTQNTHNHTILDPGHNHTQDPHTHVQDAHTHVQNAHSHAVLANGRMGGTGVDFHNTHNRTDSDNINVSTGSSINRDNGTANTTATNQNTTATNQNTTATNQASTTGISGTDDIAAINQAETAVNNTTVATNQTTIAVNDPEGGGGAHENMHPFLVCNFCIKLDI